MNRNLHPPTVKDGDLAEGFTESEFLYQELLNVGMFGDATGAISNIKESFFL